MFMLSADIFFFFFLENVPSSFFGSILFLDLFIFN